MYKLTVRRKMAKRSGDEKIKAQVEYLLERGLASNRGKGWEVKKKRLPPFQSNGTWVFQYELEFEKVSGRRGGDAEYNQWENIKAMIQQTGQNAKFQPYPWVVIEADSNAEDATLPDDEESLSDVVSDISKAITNIIGVREVTTKFSQVATWKDLAVPPELLTSDEALASHPAFARLYGLGPQIRIALSSIQRGHETDGASRFHNVFYGHAGCGKTSTLLALERMYGPGAVLRLDATSTTRAGIEKLFFSDLTEIPPLVFMEEAEKADPEALKVWLGALDDRGEIRKVNFRVNQLREVKIIFFCTVNNKTLFDRMMGSDGSEAGALSSRCVNQIYFPRPSDQILRQILQKEIDEHGGKMEWIQPCIDLAKQLDVRDPRIVRSYLAGGDRLMDETYQRDWLAVHQAAQDFRK